MKIFLYFWNKVFSATLSLVFPSFCLQCQKLGPLVCNRCFETIDFLYEQPQPKLNPLYMDDCIVACQFSGVMEKLIKSMKYQSVIDAGRFCGRLLYYCAAVPQVECIASVPIHTKRLRVRGFNQAEVIAQTLAENCGIPHQPLLIRTIHGSNQARVKTKQDRMTHVSGHFSLNPKVFQLPKSVLLVDDVFTTGSTLNECAKVLKQHGVQTVIGLAVARK